MDHQNGDTPIYFDGSMSPTRETPNQNMPNDVKENITDSDEWLRFIGANPYEFVVR